MHPQIRPVREKGTNQQADGHTCKQKGAQPVILLSAGKEKIHDSASHIDKPEQIRHDKIFVKRDVIIQPHMHHRIVPHHGPLQIQKPGQINKSIT